MNPLLSRLLPVDVAVAEAFGDPGEAVLFPGEEAAVARAVDKRRREFTAARHCARLALAQLGLPAQAIGTGPNREPLWPSGVVGSLTHCDGYRAAALARSGALASLGIDAEPHEPLPDGTLDTIARADERPMLAELAAARPDVNWDRLMFSAKESIYKAWFPLARKWLGFEEASLDIDPDSGTFTAKIHQPGAPLTTMEGHWFVGSGFILTAIAVSATVV